MSDFLKYDGRKPEPPYTTNNEETLKEAICLLMEMATEMRKFRLIFDEKDIKRINIENVTDRVLQFINENE